jgi:hypothetical protein
VAEWSARILMEIAMLPVMSSTSFAALTRGALTLPQGLFDTNEDLLLAFGFAAELDDPKPEAIEDPSELDEMEDDEEDEDDEDEDDEPEVGAPSEIE